MLNNDPKPIEPSYLKKQLKDKEDSARSMWTLSYRLKGLAAGFFLSAVYCYAYVGTYPAKFLIAGAILGYFFGWVVGSFFYKQKS